MKNLIYLVLGVMFFVSVFAVKPSAAQDPVAVDAKHYKVEFENAAVRILRVHYGAKEKSAMHEHPDAVAVSMGNMRGKFSFPTGASQIRTFKNGQVRWTPAETHLPQNLGSKSFEVILVELKGGGDVGSMPDSSNDAAKVDPKHHKVELENDRVRVLRVKIAPHEKPKMHAHPASVAIFLTTATMRSTAEDGTKTNTKAKPGMVVWRDAVKHQTENIGKTPLEAIVIELKGK